MVKSAASAASPEGFASRKAKPSRQIGFGRIWKLSLQAVIRSAATTASPKTKSKERRMAAQITDDRGRGAPLELGPPDSGSREAAVAADLITSWKYPRGGCARSRLDHGFFLTY